MRSPFERENIKAEMFRVSKPNVQNRPHNIVVSGGEVDNQSRYVPSPEGMASIVDLNRHGLGERGVMSGGPARAPYSDSDNDLSDIVAYIPEQSWLEWLWENLPKLGKKSAILNFFDPTPTGGVIQLVDNEDPLTLYKYGSSDLTLVKAVFDSETGDEVSYQIYYQVVMIDNGDGTYSFK